MDQGRDALAIERVAPIQCPAQYRPVRFFVDTKRSGKSLLWIDDAAPAGASDVLFTTFDDQLRTATAENMFSEYAINVAAFVTMRHVVPWRLLTRLFLAWCRNNFVYPGDSALGTLWISHEFSSKLIVLSVE